MTEIQFVDAPPPQRNQHKNQDIADALRKRPGEWAHIGTGNPSRATNIKTATLRAFAPAGSFEAVARNLVDGKGDIYARYVGVAS